jgi:CelD/BcsL family acetyltransferase involved in cellulose biosynthesis
MDCRIITATLDELKEYRQKYHLKLNWSSPFILPEWLEVWWRVFGSDNKPYIRIIFQGDEIIGIASLMIKDGTAYFMGGTDVCDYQDFVISAGKEQDFFSALLDDLKTSGIQRLDLKDVRPDSTVLKNLVPLAEKRQYIVAFEKEAVSFEMDLPSSFEEYLNSLSAKQRHEVRRKMRRLNEEGSIVYRSIDKGEELTAALETFYKMFVESRQDKAAFLTEQMKDYFQQLTTEMENIGLLKLGVLELDNKPIAAIMCFDYNRWIYLYNSGYDPQYVGLSAGLLSKVYAIKDSVEKGKKKFDFLKGDEPYKGHLGGKEVPLYRCQISISSIQ